MTLNQLFSKLTKEKFYPSWGYFGRSSKNIYNLPKIMLHVSPWTLILMLHIRQSIYFVLTNVLFTSFLMFHIKFNEISTTLSMQFWYIGRYTRYMWSNDIFKVWNCVSAKDRECCLHILPKQHTFFIHGLIFDIMNTKTNLSLEFEWKPMLAPLRSVNDQRFSWLHNVFLKIFQGWLNHVQKCPRNFERDAGQKNVHIDHGAANIWRIENKR